MSRDDVDDVPGMTIEQARRIVAALGLATVVTSTERRAAA